MKFYTWIICFSLFVLFSTDVFSQTTTIWLVRHAEKDTTVQSRDPELSEQGKKRAVKLAAYLSKTKPDIIYSTNYIRTRQTAAQVPAEIINYNPRDLKKLAADILSGYKGKKILIVGHSNTVLETVEALGGKKPMDVMNESDYQYIIRVQIQKDGEVKTDLDTY